MKLILFLKKNPVQLFVKKREKEDTGSKVPFVKVVLSH